MNMRMKQGCAMRLVTTVRAEKPRGNEVDVSAVLELELDGNMGRVTLLGDRGWSTNQRWNEVHLNDVEKTARTCVGPDEPFEGRTTKEMEDDYWTYLERIGAGKGLSLTASELSGLPHDVEFSAELLRLLGDS